MSSVAESTVEEAALSWFEELGYTIVHGPDIAPGELFAERDGYGDVVLVKRLHEALHRINPDVPAEAGGRLQVPASDRQDRRYFRPLSVHH